MKKVLLSILIFASLSTKAQDSTVVADTVIYSKGAIHIEPIIVNAQGDSAYSIVWSAFGLSSNGEGCNTYVTLRSKINEKLADFNCAIPSYIVDIWGIDNTIIDNYILSQYPRFKKQD
jgi:hypothetical protein